MDTHLKAGIAIYNSGEFHAAHDAWEDHWLQLEKGTLDEKFLHGLIQFTAAIYHGTTRNWQGLRGLANSAHDYLEPHPHTYLHVSLDPIREYLTALAADPEHIERHYPPKIFHEERPICIEHLSLQEKFIVASVLAEAHDTYDVEIIDKAIENAKNAIDTNRSSKYIGLVSDFASRTDNRQLIYDRMSSMISRQRQRDEDVAGLFDE